MSEMTEKTKTSVAPYLPRLPYWNELAPEEKEFVRRGAFIRRVGKGRFIHGGAADCPGMVMLLGGGMRAYMLSDAGREVTLFRLRGGDCCVFSAACAVSRLSFDTLIVAEDECEMLVIPVGIFSELAERNVYVRCFMCEIIAERFSAVMDSVSRILFKGFPSRLAAFLMSEYAAGCAEVRMTHEQIARSTSSAREVVARSLKRFSDDGLVELRRGVVTIKSPERLRKLI